MPNHLKSGTWWAGSSGMWKDRQLFLLRQSGCGVQNSALLSCCVQELHGCESQALHNWARTVHGLDQKSMRYPPDAMIPNYGTTTYKVQLKTLCNYWCHIFHQIAIKTQHHICDCVSGVPAAHVPWHLADQSTLPISQSAFGIFMIFYDHDDHVWSCFDRFPMVSQLSMQEIGSIPFHSSPVHSIPFLHVGDVFLVFPTFRWAKGQSATRSAPLSRRAKALK